MDSMDLSDRLKIVLEDNGLKQKELAHILGTSTSYISAIITQKDKKMSHSLAFLLEEKLGYSTDWILNGVGPVRKNAGTMLTPPQKAAITLIEKMGEKEVDAVLAFLNFLEDVKADVKGERFAKSLIKHSELENPGGNE